jgi:hypothetical protein
VLVRLLNASYGMLRTTLGLDALVVGVDGRALGRPGSPWSRPFTIPANTPFELSTAQRYDMIVSSANAGTFPVKFEFLNWITRAIQDNGRGIANTRIVVT